ncbi:MAG: hypothetical protein RLN77_09030 [Rhodospirillales bacterium]
MDRIEKSFEFANEIGKQIITLSTGVLALSATFFEKIAKESGDNIILLYWSWSLFISSIILGIITMGALTSQLAPKLEAPDHIPSINSVNVKIPAVSQWLAFIAAMILFLVYVAKTNQTITP